MRMICTIFAGLLGLAFGSFLNVLVSRWPQGESVVEPGSHCTSCGRTLAWWENVPLISWITLRGRCRTCGVWIGWRYVLVEAAVGGLWAELAWRSLLRGGNWLAPTLAFDILSLALSMALIWLLVALAALDVEHLWLPDRLTYFGIGLGLAAGFGEPILLSSIYGGLSASVLILGLYRLVGALAGAGLILLIRWVYWLVRRREGIGLGDAKLMAMLGAWLGFEGALLGFGIGVVLGALTGVVVLARGRKANESAWLTRLPLGTFLCVGGIVSTLWGPALIAAYLRWARW